MSTGLRERGRLVVSATHDCGQAGGGPIGLAVDDVGAKLGVLSMRTALPVELRGAGLAVTEVDGHRGAQHIAEAAVTFTSAAGVDDTARTLHAEGVPVTALRRSALRALCQRWLPPSAPLAIDDEPLRRPSVAFEREPSAATGDGAHPPAPLTAAP